MGGGREPLSCPGLYEWNITPRFNCACAFPIGLLLTATGLLWMGQGAGYIMWPQSSFMLLQTQWVYYGALTVTLGVAFVLAGLFKRR